MIDVKTRALGAWIAVALGQGAFLALHLVQYLGDVAKEVSEVGHDHNHGHHDHLAEITAMSDPGMLWMMVAWQVLALAPVVLAVMARGRGSLVALLAVGGLGALAGAADGVMHAVADGHVHSAVASLLLVGVPGVIAVLATVGWLRSTRVSTAAAEAINTAD